MNSKFLLNCRKPAKFKKTGSTIKAQTSMHFNPRLKSTRLVYRLIAITWAACLLAVRADDTTTATPSATTNMTVAATLSEGPSFFTGCRTGCVLSRQPKNNRQLHRCHTPHPIWLLTSNSLKTT
ncbi:MAG: hypothetical protein WAO02_06015 [Verrucomicrobiia bacterium]